MDRPTPPSGPDREPDLPKPPIWEEHRAFDAPHPTTPPADSFPTPDISIGESGGPDGAAIMPDDLETTTPIERPLTPPSAAFRSASAPMPPLPPTPPDAGPRPTTPAPASGVHLSGDKPRWPAVPPTADTTTSPTPPRPPASRRRVGLVIFAFFALTGLIAGAFLLGRNIGGEETATVPVASPSADEVADAPAVAPEEPTTEPAEVPPTAVPATPEPTEAPEIDAPRLEVPPPVVPDDAAEPVAAVAEAVAPAVVLIQTEGGQGSGIIYDEAGLILTNAHVVGQFTEVSVQLASGIRVEGTVLGADENTDVAVVSIGTDEEFGVAPLAPESTVEVGQLAVAIGSPFGLEQTVTSGIVSATGRVVGTVAMIQTDAPINPGNSGGALADRQGRVIGMNTAIRTDGSGGNIGVGFAIPADTAKLVADRIIAGDSLEQGYLGIEGATPQLGDPGVVVTRVIPETGAAAAGVQVDDLIVGFNGVEIRSMGDLAAAVRLRAPDEVVEVVVQRNGERIALVVTLGTLPS